jgi:hypothetical protein
MTTWVGEWSKCLHVLPAFCITDRWLQGVDLKKRFNRTAAESQEESESEDWTSWCEEFRGKECNTPETTPLFHCDVVEVPGGRRCWWSYLCVGFTKHGWRRQDAQCVLCCSVLYKGSCLENQEARPFYPVDTMRGTNVKLKDLRKIWPFFIFMIKLVTDN